MGSHKIHIEPNGTRWDVRCSCRKTAPHPLDTRTEALEWEAKHLEEIQRTRELLRDKRTPSLEDQRDYYLTKAADTTESEKNRRLWNQLAQEINVRIGKNTEQDPLF